MATQSTSIFEVLSAVRFAAFFSEKGKAIGVLSVPPTVSKERRKMIRTYLEARAAYIISAEVKDEWGQLVFMADYNPQLFVDLHGTCRVKVFRDKARTLESIRRTSEVLVSIISHLQSEQEPERQQEEAETDMVPDLADSEF